ncbi:MAG: class I adenylate-forming enzyme family protein [Pirellulales bacterium]
MHRLLKGGEFLSRDAAAPILAALRSYRGDVIDLEAGSSVHGPALSSAADQITHRLVVLGLAAGDRVVLSVGNGPAFIAALCGTLAAGGTPLLLHGDTPASELYRFAHGYTARWLLTERPLVAESIRHSGIPDWLQLHTTVLRPSPISPTYPNVTGATLHPTSGTTGQAKIAVRTALQSAEEGRHYIDTMQITASDRILCVVPMSHAYGFGMGFMVPLLSGATLVTTRQFNPRNIPRVLADERITIFPAVPAMLELLLRAGLDGAPLPRLVLAAGAPLAETTATAFRQQTGIPITPLYGTTETGGITVAVGEVETLSTGCVGRPMPGVEAQVTAIRDAAELPTGVGRVSIRSSSMMSGYLTPDGIDASAIHEGFFATGDLGRLDPSGRIQIVGRDKEIINVFGLKVVPSEVEEVIAALAGVREVKVYAGTHRSGSELVKAAVASEKNADQAAIDAAQVRAHCEAHLPPYKRPQVIHLVAALPRTPTGKIIRDQLP